MISQKNNSSISKVFTVTEFKTSEQYNKGMIWDRVRQITELLTKSYRTQWKGK